MGGQSMNITISNSRAAKAAEIHASRFFLLGQCASMEGFDEDGRNLDNIGMLFYNAEIRLKRNEIKTER
jgi:hypothetical protein